jgi:ATP-dependent RNA helicase RhlE
VVRQLLGEGIKADAIHSNKSQAARQRALSAFHGGRIKVLVATDIAARGIDVEGISHVINYEMPNDPESYVHRIGRTARAGTAGMALSFCNADEIPLLGGIEKLTRSPLVAVDDHPFHSDAIASLHGRLAPARSGVTQVKPKRPQFGRKRVVENPSTRSRGRR